MTCVLHERLLHTAHCSRLLRIVQWSSSPRITTTVAVMIFRGATLMRCVKDLDMTQGRSAHHQATLDRWDLACAGGQ